MDIANLIIRVTNDGLDRATRELRRLQDQAQGTQTSTGKLAKNMKRLAKLGAVSLGGLAVAAIKVSGDFEESMDAVRAVSGATGKDFDDLRNLAKKMGSETAFSATEAANGMEYLAMAGLNTEQVLATIPNALSLAAAGSIDLAQSADILSNVMSGMGIAAEESGRVADVLAATAAGANTNISALGEAMKYVAPIAKTMGYSLEEASAAVGVLGNAGIAAGQAGTNLRAIMSRIAADKGAKETLADLGVVATDSQGKMRSLTDILTDLEGATKNLSSEARIEIFKDIAGAEAMGGLAVLVDGVANDSLPQLIEKLKQAEGAAKEMAAIRMEGLNGAIKTAKSAAEGFLIALGDAGLLDLAANGVKMLADGISQLSVWLPQAAEQVQAFFESAEVATAVDMAIEGLTSAWENLVSVIQATADVIAPVIEFFREHDKLSEALAISIGLVGGAFVIYNAAVIVGTAATAAFTAVLAFVTAPLTLIVLAMVALTAAGVYLYQNWDTIKAKAIEIWGNIKTYISNKVEETKQAMIDKFNAAKDAVINKWNELKSKAVDKFNEIKNVIITTLKELPTKLLQVGKDIVQGLINGIKSGISGVTTAISDMASGAVAKAKSVLDINSPSKVMRKIGDKGIGGGLAQGIKKGAKAVKTEAQKMAEQAIKAVEDGIAGLQKRIALFGDSSALSSLLYDIDVGKFKGASQARIDEWVRQAKALEGLEAQLKATNAVQARFDKWQDERDVMRKKATGLITDRFAKLKTDKAASSDNLQGMLSGIEQESPLGKIQADYESRLETIENYENLHTDMVETAAAARLAVEQSYMDSKRDLMLTQGEALFGDLAGLAKGFAGEQSGIYKALFAVEKGFAIAQSAIAIQQSIAKAMALGFPQNIPVIGQAISQGAGIMSSIKGITAGFKQGGYTGNMGASQVAGVVHGQEYVFDAQSTKRIGVDNLNAMRSGRAANDDSKVNVNIINNSSAKVTASDDGQTITISDVRNEVKRGFTELNNPNSHSSKMVNRNVQAARRR